VPLGFLYRGECPSAHGETPQIQSISNSKVLRTGYDLGEILLGENLRLCFGMGIKSLSNHCCRVREGKELEGGVMARHETRTRERPGVAALVWTSGTPAAHSELRSSSASRRSLTKGRKEKLGRYWAHLGRLVVAKQATIELRIGKEKRERAGPARGRNSVSAQATRKIGNHFF
jgi:hypothetical protein